MKKIEIEIAISILAIELMPCNLGVLTQCHNSAFVLIQFKSNHLFWIISNPDIRISIPSFKLSFLFAGERGLEICGHGAWPTIFMDLYVSCVCWDSRYYPAGAQPLRRAEADRSGNFRHRLGPTTPNEKQRLQIENHQ